MIFQLFRRSSETRIIAALYGTIVAQGRAPAFYQTYGVPDTVDGRSSLAVPMALAEALGRTIFGLDQGTNIGARRLAAYAREALRQLAAQDENQFRSAELVFPDPDKIPSLRPEG